MIVVICLRLAEVYVGRYEWCERDERIGGERPRENELRELWSCADACIGQVSVHKSREEKCVIKFGKKKWRRAV